MQIYRLSALQDNYIFLLHDPEQHIAAVVDPAVADPVLQQLLHLKANLVAIFNTHHHSDHVGGNLRLRQQFPQLVVYGGVEDRGRIPGQQVFLQAGDRVQFADREAEVLFIPGHTRAHIAYYFPPQQPMELENYSVAIPCLQGAVGDYLKAHRRSNDDILESNSGVARSDPNLVRPRVHLK